MVVYVVTYYDGNTMPGEERTWVESTEKKAEKRVGQVMLLMLDEVRNTQTRGRIEDLIDDGKIDEAYRLFSGDGGKTGMLQILVDKKTVGK